ncbi:MAG: amidohydrolase family protein [Planctomycetota bacterium]
MSSRNRWNRAFRTSLAAAVLVTASYAQEDEASEKQKPEEKKPAVTAIQGGDVYTVTGEIIRGGTVLVQDGKILDVGQELTVPEGAKVIDATGKVVTPGFVAISMSGVGISGGGRGGRGGRGGGEEDEEAEEEIQLVDRLDPFDRNIKYSLGTGITTGCIQLSSGGGRGRRGRNGEPVEVFLGLEPDPRDIPDTGLIDEDGDGQEDHVCSCCDLPIAPTEPITAAPPTEAEPREHAVLKMSYGNLDAMLVTEDAFYDLAPGALATAENLYEWRAAIRGAREAIRQEEQAQSAAREAAIQTQSQGQEGRGRRGGRGGAGGFGARGGRGGRGGGNTVSPELRKLVEKEIALRTSANTVSEIRDMIALAEELDYRLVLEGVVEGWLVASELSEADVSVVYTPRERRDGRLGEEDTSGSSIESSAIYERLGVPFAVSALSSSISLNGLAGRDLTSLPLEAAFAVRGGASSQAALEALTIVPARMLGLADRIGSIEKGKDADILILNGHPLDYRTYVETALVAGQVAYERAEDRVFPVYDRN